MSSTAKLNYKIISLILFLILFIILIAIWINVGGSVIYWNWKFLIITACVIIGIAVFIFLIFLIIFIIPKLFRLESTYCKEIKNAVKIINRIDTSINEHNLTLPLCMYLYPDQLDTFKMDCLTTRHKKGTPDNERRTSLPCGQYKWKFYSEGLFFLIPVATEQDEAFPDDILKKLVNKWQKKLIKKYYINLIVSIPSQFLHIDNSEKLLKKYSENIQKLVNKISNLEDCFFVPKFILVTECQNIEGFNDFFDNLNNYKDQDKAFGAFNNFDQFGALNNSNQSIKNFVKYEFEQIVNSLKKMRLCYNDLKNDALIFPDSFSCCENNLIKFVEKVCVNIEKIQGLYFIAGN